MERLKAQECVGVPTLTVVVPCYNYGHYLQTAVRSALDQTGVEVDVIVVDDASTDNSRAVALSLAESDPRVQLVTHEHNLGHIETYNDGLSRATGDYVVLLSADDVLAPGSLERAAALFEARPDVGLVYGFVPDFTDEVPPPNLLVRDWSVWQGHEWIAHVCRRGRNIIVTPEAVVRRSIMDKLGGFEQAFPHSADMYLWMRAAAIANVGRVNGPDQAYYRTHGQNMHVTSFGGHLTDKVEVRRTFEKFFDSDGSEVDDAFGLYRTACRAIAKEALRSSSLLADAGHSDDANDLLAFAEETWPEIIGSISWRWAKRAPHFGVSRSVARTVDGTRWAMRWRRWRRDGT